MNADGMEARRETVLTRADALLKFAATLQPGDRVAVEASSSGRFVHRVLRDAGADVRLVHPAGIPAIAHAKVKTDDRDAEVLAQLLRTNYLHEAWAPPQDIQEIRDLVRCRVDLGRKMTAAKKQIHALLTWNGVEVAESDLFGKRGLARLASLELPENHRRLLDLLLRQILLYAEPIESLQADMARVARKRKDVRRWMTYVGISYYSGLAILGEVGDFRRFPTKKHLASWAGLAPGVHPSGDVSRTGHITKKGTPRLRWILTVCAHAAVKGPGLLRARYERLKARKGPGKALVAIAHKILRNLWAMMVRGEDCEHAVERNVAGKTYRMERKARRPAVVPDLAATTALFTPKVRRRVSREVAVR